MATPSKSSSSNPSTGAIASADSNEDSDQALIAAAEMIVKREKTRRKRSAARARKLQEQSLAQMRQSIEVIKWCVLGISTVIVLTFVIGLYVLHQVSTEVNRIKSEVAGIQREAELIRDKIRHPLETLGGSLGRRLEDGIGGMMRGDDKQP